MKLIIKRENKILKETNNINDVAVVEEFERLFNDEPIESYKIKFKQGVLVKDTGDFTDMRENLIEEIVITII